MDRFDKRPIAKMNNDELRDEVEFIISMMGKGPIGNSDYSRVRIATALREACRRMEVNNGP